MAGLNEMKQLMRDALKEMEWKYDCEDHEDYSMYRAGVTLDEGLKISKIAINIEVHEDSIRIISMSDIRADKKNISKVAEYICRVNWGLLVGNFEFNYDTGNIRYKVFLNASDNELNKKEIIFAIYIASEMWNKYGNGLVDLLGSEKEAKEIVGAVEKIH